MILHSFDNSSPNEELFNLSYINLFVLVEMLAIGILMEH